MQTAVLGSAESETPIMLPMHAIDLSRFRADHADDTFWCGRWLGGCGGQLITKRYETRACHFSHLLGADRRPCHRAAVGITSADHLYIQQQILAWLTAQGIDARARIPDGDGQPLGGEVLFDYARAKAWIWAAPRPQDGSHRTVGPVWRW